MIDYTHNNVIFNYNCDGECIADIDCAGECGGDAIVDECGQCNGDGSSCADVSLSFGQLGGNVLTNLYLDNFSPNSDSVCLSNVIVSGPGGNSLSVNIGECIDSNDPMGLGRIRAVLKTENTTTK